MNSTTGLFEELVYALISIPFYIKEALSPSQSKPSDFEPVDTNYKDSCFYLTFPCRKFQLQRTAIVKEYWENTCYINQDDKFVFVEVVPCESPFSELTIRFRPKIANTVINNFYNSNVSFNTQINNYQIEQVEKFQRYILESNDLENAEKDKYISILNDMKKGGSPNKESLNTLWNYIIKIKEVLSTIADITGIISFVLGFFQ